MVQDPPTSSTLALSPWDQTTITAAGAPVLQGKHILLGVTGGIAIYKSIELCRLLVKAGAKVKVVMTSGALAFIQPLTFQAVTGHAPHVDLLNASAEAGMGHIELGRWADLLVISPCSANRLAYFAQGLAPDLLSTLVLATPAPILIAPVMNQQMWAHPAVQRNCQQLLKDGITLIKPAAGLQACGDDGPGRAQEPALILGALEIALGDKSLQSFKMLVTAGPTREAIDPVRFLSNHSSGLMGYALARAGALKGADVTLVSGPSQCPAPYGVNLIQVESASEMLEACKRAGKASHYDIIIGAAAVADFKPSTSATHKLGKQELQNQIKLAPNPDIITLLASTYPKSFRVGFAAQTHDLTILATEKMNKKGLKLICANDVSDPCIGFNAPQNTITLLSPQKREPLTIGPMPKPELAQCLVAAIQLLFTNA